MIKIILIYIIVITNLILILYIIFSRNILNDSIKNKFLEHNKDLFQKMDFLSNMIQNSKVDMQYQTNIALDPITKNLDLIRYKTEEIERSRIAREITTQNMINNLLKAQESLYGATNNLEKETAKMINGFKRPHIRGKWGEAQLKRIADMTGMLQYCDFEIQKSINDIRPDMTVYLPNGGHIFVDSKAPLEPYLQMLEDEDDEKFRKENAKNIRNHISLLSSKEYWKSANSPELVIMFLPVEFLYIYAMEEDAKLLEYATAKNIILATPMTLIGLLKSIYYGWSQVSINKDAAAIKILLSDIYNILKKNIDIMQKQQKNLSKSVNEISVVASDLLDLQNKIASINSIKLYENNGFILCET